MQECKTKPGTEHLILFDVNGDGVFDPGVGDSMELIAPNFEGCWICLVGILNASDPLVAIVKSQADYAGKTVQEITESLK